VYINKTLSTDSLINQLLIKTVVYQLVLIVGMLGEWKMFQLSTICHKGFGREIFILHMVLRHLSERSLSTLILSDCVRLLPKYTVLQSETRPTRPYPPCSCHTRPAEDIPRFLPPSPVPLQYQNALRRLKFSFACTGNGNQKLNLSSFREPLTARPRKSSKSTFVPGTNFLYQTEPSLVHFLYR